MKTRFRILFYSLIVAALFSTTTLAAPSIVFNDKLLSSDVAPIVEKGVTLVPLRVILETFGATVNYETKTKKITVYKDNLNISMIIGEKTAILNGSNYTLLVPAKVIQSRTVVPLRFISESLQAKVDWNNTTKTVTINYQAAVPNANDNAQISNYEKQILELVNETRREMGLKELVWVDEVASVARAHSQDMAENKFFDHTSPTTGSPSDRSQKAGLPGVGENIAAGPLTPQTVHEAWMNSPGHRANLLNPDYRFIGIGLYFSNEPNDELDGKYFTENFVAGDTFFTSPFNNAVLNNPSVTVTGYSVAANPKLTVYKMIDDKTYSDSYEVPLNVVNNKFNQTIELKFGSGNYQIWASGFDYRAVTVK